MLVVVLALVLLPILTYYVSTHHFYRRANSKTATKTPPTVPYLLPGIFHAFNLAYERPQKYFATLIKDYGNFAPFLVRVATRSFVVLRDPQHIKHVLDSTNSHWTDAEFSRRVFGAPEVALELYADTGVSEGDKTMFEHVRTVLPRKYLTGAALEPLTEAYMSTLSRNMHDKMFQVGSWTLIEDFWSFFQQVITRCTIQTLFGSAFLKQYPGFIKDYWAFEDAIQAFVPGMPQILSSAAHEVPRDRLLQGIEKWLKVYHSGSEFAKIEQDDPICDDYRGSKFIQETDAMFAKMNGIDVRARAAEMLSIMQCSTSISVTNAFWTMVEILRKPDLAKYMKTEIANHYSSHSARPDLSGLTRMPMLQSIETEVERLRIAKFIIRHVDVDDCRIDDLWLIPRGSFTMSFSCDIGLNTSIWADAQPHSVVRPLKDFWAERFLHEEKSVKAHHDKKKGHGFTSKRFGLDGLEPIALALRGDRYARLGQDYSQAIQAATLAVLLTEFELHLSDPGALDSAPPPGEGTAYGMVEFLDKVAVRIRKRTADE